jgi:hypothetical protein
MPMRRPDFSAIRCELAWRKQAGARLSERAESGLQAEPLDDTAARWQPLFKDNAGGKTIVI